MSYLTATASDLISGALRNINVLAAGETMNPTESADAIQALNDLLDSWSTQKLYVVSSTENILNLVPNQYQYTIGNPVGGTFSGTVTFGSNLITGVTVPANLVVGATISDPAPGAGAIPAGTTATAVDPIGGVVTLSANSTQNTGDTITYTVPGDFAIPRPLRITNAFTRITSIGSTGLDYPINIVHRDKYTQIGIKGISGPWPTLLYYDPTYPYGTLYFYPNPSQAGELHLWTDSIFSSFTTINQSVNLPQGYALAIKKSLALQLAPEYGKSPSPLLIRQADEAVRVIKQLNAEPAVQAFFDQHILKSRRNDASFIMDGGFNR